MRFNLPQGGPLCGGHRKRWTPSKHGAAQSALQLQRALREKRVSRRPGAALS